MSKHKNVGGLAKIFISTKLKFCGVIYYRYFKDEVSLIIRIKKVEFMRTCLINDNKNAIVQERTKIGFEWDSFLDSVKKVKVINFSYFIFINTRIFNWNLSYSILSSK